MILRVSSIGHLETVDEWQLPYLQHQSYAVGWDSPDISAHALIGHCWYKVSMVLIAELHRLDELMWNMTVEGIRGTQAAKIIQLLEQSQHGCHSRTVSAERTHPIQSCCFAVAIVRGTEVQCRLLQ